MKKRHIVIAACLVCVLCQIFSGCGEQQMEKQGLPECPEISADFIYLAGEQVFLDYSAYDAGNVLIPLLSGTPLTQEDITLTIAGTKLTEAQYYFASNGREERVELPFYVYQTFRGKDWKKAASLQLEYHELRKASEEGNGEDEALQEAADALRSSQNEYLADYQSLQQVGKLPVLYRYLLGLALPTDQPLSDMPITEITISVNQTDHTFPLGELRYRADSSFPSLTPGTLVPCAGIAGWHGASTDAAGNVAEADGIENNRFRAEEDVFITAIDLWEDERQISDIQIIILNAPPSGEFSYDSEGNELSDIISDFLWDGKTPIQLLKGQELAINFTFHDPRLANAPCGYTQYHLAVHYENAEGQQGIALQWFPTRIETVSGDPFEIYLHYVLGIDTMRYYTDYYDVLDAAGAGITIIDSIQKE